MVLQSSELNALSESWVCVKVRVSSVGIATCNHVPNENTDSCEPRKLWE